MASQGDQFSPPTGGLINTCITSVKEVSSLKKHWKSFDRVIKDNGFLSCRGNSPTREEVFFLSYCGGWCLRDPLSAFDKVRYDVCVCCKLQIWFSAVIEFPVVVRFD
jgi:hypothetical protein